MSASTCKTCGAPVIWAVTSKGANMPLDAAPDPGGNFKIMAGPTRNLAVTMGRDEEHVGNRFTSHFATCPQSDSHRRSRK